MGWNLEKSRSRCSTLLRQFVADRVYEEEKREGVLK
jgi:hypothetical protein